MMAIRAGVTRVPIVIPIPAPTQAPSNSTTSSSGSRPGCHGAEPSTRAPIG